MDYAGLWRCRIHTPLGVQDVLLAVEEHDGILSGEARGAETVPLIEPRLREGRLYWMQKVAKPMRLTIAFDVIREGDRLVGTAKPGLLPRVRVEGVLVTDPAGSVGPSEDHAGDPPVGVAREDRDTSGVARTRWPSMSVDTSSLSGKRIEVGMLVFPGMTALDLIGPHTVLSGPASVRLI